MDTNSSEQDILNALSLNKQKFEQLYLNKPNPIDTLEFNTLKSEFFSLKQQLNQLKALPYNLIQENNHEQIQANQRNPHPTRYQ